VHDDGYFDERIAATYDDDAEMAAPDVVEPVVNCLAELAGSGGALEFGIGTGRIALPLVRRGIAVHGIELSRAMVARMAAKSGGSEVPVTIGDFSAARAPGEFALVYLVFNTIMNLTTQAAQVACFRNAAAHLGSGGYFVIEVMVPRLRQLGSDDTHAFHVSDSHWGIDEYEPVTQALVSHHLRIGEDGRAERFSAPFRYVWPAELDLMAQLAGMTLKARWGGWDREPFTRASDSHVSVWEHPGP
jgi:hypothetical protein